MNRKGIILAGGSGTSSRRGGFEAFAAYHDNDDLLSADHTHAGIQEILVISALHRTFRARLVLGDGHRWGLELRICDLRPAGRQAFVIGRDLVMSEQHRWCLATTFSYGNELAVDLNALRADQRVPPFPHVVIER